MQENRIQLEHRLAAAAIAWQDMNAASSTITRLNRYKAHSAQMKLDLGRAWHRYVTAHAQITDLLKTPHIESFSPNPQTGD